MIEPQKVSITSLITDRTVRAMNRGWSARLWHLIKGMFPKKAITLYERFPEGTGLGWNEITMKQLGPIDPKGTVFSEGSIMMVRNQKAKPPDGKDYDEWGECSLEGLEITSGDVPPSQD